MPYYFSVRSGDEATMVSARGEQGRSSRHGLAALARRLRNQRLEAGWSQPELAERVGVSKQWVAALESEANTKTPSLEQLRRFEETFRLPPGELTSIVSDAHGREVASAVEAFLGSFRASVDRVMAEDATPLRSAANSVCGPAEDAPGFSAGSRILSGIETILATAVGLTGAGSAVPSAIRGITITAPRLFADDSDAAVAFRRRLVVALQKGWRVTVLVAFPSDRLDDRLRLMGRLVPFVAAGGGLFQAHVLREGAQLGAPVLVAPGRGALVFLADEDAPSDRALLVPEADRAAVEAYGEHAARQLRRHGSLLFTGFRYEQASADPAALSAAFARLYYDDAMTKVATGDIDYCYQVKRELSLLHIPPDAEEARITALATGDVDPDRVAALAYIAELRHQRARAFHRQVERPGAEFVDLATMAGVDAQVDTGRTAADDFVYAPLTEAQRMAYLDRFVGMLDSADPRHRPNYRLGLLADLPADVYWEVKGSAGAQEGVFLTAPCGPVDGPKTVVGAAVLDPVTINAFRAYFRQYLLPAADSEALGFVRERRRLLAERIARQLGNPFATG
jgi:transcriptional regulator with XRE-family HTH domain